MPIVAMNTDNPLGQRPFGAMGGMDGTWDLSEQHRSWIVRDTDSAPIEHMRVPPELLGEIGMTIPVAANLYKPGPAPFIIDRVFPENNLRISPTTWISPAPPAPPVYESPVCGDHCTGTVVTSLLTPGGTTPPVIPTVQHQEPSFAEIVPQGSPIVAIGPGSSTQNVVPVSIAAQQAAPGLTSILASGQPASSAQSIDSSWFTDPAQEIIPGVPNWGLMAAIVLAAMWSKGKSTR